MDTPNPDRPIHSQGVDSTSIDRAPPTRRRPSGSDGTAEPPAERADSWTKGVVRYLGEIAGRLEGGSGLLVATDFDGTIAPIADDPDHPRITPANATALATLAARDLTVVAVVSGRELGDLQSRVEISGVVYAGNHGLELARGPDRVTHPEARRHRPALDRAAALLQNALGDVPGCLIEDKILSLTVHYRQVPGPLQPTVTDHVDALAPQLDDRLRLVPGRKAIEIRPRIDWDKGEAVRWVRSTLPDGYRAVYLGDDTTDEDVFRLLHAGDVGVHVGPGATAAEYRLTSQRDVAPFLDWLARRVSPGA